jgi:uncharacterized protein YegP (UPF0339 family)
MAMRTWSIGFGVLLAFLAAPLGDERLGSGQLQAAQPGQLKFEIYQDTNKEYRWRLKAANGEILATAGEGYKAKADCQKGIDALKAEAAANKLKPEVYEDKAKEHRWRVKAANGQIIAISSEGYKAKADVDKAIDLIRKGAAKAEVEDKT